MDLALDFLINLLCFSQTLSFGDIRIFENEDKTRTFIALGVNTGDYPVLNGIVGRLDSCLQEFNLPPFYEVC